MCLLGITVTPINAHAQNGGAGLEAGTVVTKPKSVCDFGWSLLGSRPSYQVFRDPTPLGFGTLNGQKVRLQIFHEQPKYIRPKMSNRQIWFQFMSNDPSFESLQETKEELYGSDPEDVQGNPKDFKGTKVYVRDGDGKTFVIFRHPDESDVEGVVRIVNDAVFLEDLSGNRRPLSGILRNRGTLALIERP